MWLFTSYNTLNMWCLYYSFCDIGQWTPLINLTSTINFANEEKQIKRHTFLKAAQLDRID